MIPQAWPLVARTRAGEHYFVIGWREDPRFPCELLVPVVVPRTLYGKAARSTSQPATDGGREDVFEFPPAAPTILNPADIDGWIGPPLHEP